MPETTYSVDEEQFNDKLFLCEMDTLKDELLDYSSGLIMEALTEGEVQNIQIALLSMSYQFSQKVQAVMNLLPSTYPPLRPPIVH